MNSANSAVILTLGDGGLLTTQNDIVRSGFGRYPYDAMNRASVRITDGTAAPSGGSDGDIYFQYT
ncbi:MAG: hypothetical protein ACTHOJ_18090 [Sphingomonas oligoaromativorans]